MNQAQYNTLIENLLDEVKRNNEEIKSATKLLHKYSEESVTKEFLVHIHNLANRKGNIEQILEGSRWV